MKVLPLHTSIPDKVVQQAATVLNNGGMVVYPTETCYGIGVDATNTEAVNKLLVYKGGREGKAISVAVSDRIMASKYVSINEMAEHIYAQFLPGPVTVVSTSLGTVAEGLVSDRKTLGIRIPDKPMALQLIQALGKPITATSANTSGKKTPYSLDDLKKYTSDKKLAMIDLFLDDGLLPHHPPSTVVDTTLNEISILRQGEIHLTKQTKNQKVSHAESETQDIAADLTRQYLKTAQQKPLVMALQGELGAGKTQFAKGVAKALGIGGNVPSPTYTIVREYSISSPEHNNMMYHIDTWRLHEGKELWELGLTEMVCPGNVVVIEWLQKVKPLVEKLENMALVVWIEIEQTSEATRTIRWWNRSYES